jgi:hypothetical protein
MELPRDETEPDQGDPDCEIGRGEPTRSAPAATPKVFDLQARLASSVMRTSTQDDFGPVVTWFPYFTTWWSS